MTGPTELARGRFRTCGPTDSWPMISEVLGRYFAVESDGHMGMECEKSGYATVTLWNNGGGGGGRRRREEEAYHVPVFQEEKKRSETRALGFRKWLSASSGFLER